MLKDKKWGIDLNGRKMWYEPWPIDQYRKYRNPSEKEIEDIYSISGEAIAETLQYFIECGGDVDKLVQMLNKHVIDERFFINEHNHTLLLYDKTRWYNNEYYFYFIMFTKKIIGRYDFHFGENKDEQLSVYHKIYEKGFMDFIPWGVDENGDEIKDVTVSNNLMLITHSEEVLKDNIYDFIIFINSNLSEIYKVDRKFYDNENIWCSLEFIEYGFEFIKILNNSDSFLMEASYNGSINKLKVIKIFSIFPKKFLLSVYKLSAAKINNIHDFKIIHKSNNFKLSLSLKQNFNKKKYSKYLASSIKNDAFVWRGATAAAITIIYNLNVIPLSDLKINGYLENPSLEISYKWKFINTKLLFKIISGIILPYIPCYFFVFVKFLSMQSYLIVSSFISIITSIIVYLFESKRVLNKKMIENLKVTNEQLLILEKTTSELLKEKNSLEQKVIERTKQLEDANKQKTIFFVNLTHEIKTPLTLALNYLDKHKKNHGTTNEIKVVEQNLSKLKNDIMNFMDTEKLENGRIIYNHDKIINLSDALNIKTMMFNEIAIKKNIKIFNSIDDNIYIKIDPSAIDKIINNLIDNSIKYTPENGKINIILKNNGNESDLIINDTGIGISKEDQKYIFEPYYQITHKKRNIQGIGMGLNIVKKIIEEINAKIEVESEPDKGSTFKITFKNHKLIEGEIVDYNINYTKPIDNVSTFKLKEPVYDENKNNVFLIEDNINMLAYLENNISDHYNVFYALNGKEALEKLDNIPKPDLIISDIMMDIMDGYDFYDELMKKDIYKSIPFIFLTAKGSEDDKIHGLKKGAVDYIYKPFNIEELLVKINSLIKIKSSQKEINIKEIEDKISNIIRTDNKDIKNYSFNQKCLKYRITNKEKETINLLLEGLESKEISERLELPINTVKKRISYIYKKCGVQNKVELFKIFY